MLSKISQAALVSALAGDPREEVYRRKTGASNAVCAIIILVSLLSKAQLAISPIRLRVSVTVFHRYGVSRKAYAYSIWRQAIWKIILAAQTCSCSTNKKASSKRQSQVLSSSAVTGGEPWVCRRNHSRSDNTFSSSYTELYVSVLLGDLRGYTLLPFSSFRS